MSSPVIEKKNAGPNAPKVESDAPASPPEGRSLSDCLEGAKRGDRDALARLSHLLDERPDLVAQYGEIAGTTQLAYIRLLAGGNFIMKSSMMRRLETLKKELMGDDPNALERLLVERVAAAWLQSEHADIIAAVADDHESLKLAAFKIKRQDAAQRRFLRAAQTLAMVRRITAGTITVEVKQSRQAAPVSQANETVDLANSAPHETVCGLSTVSGSNGHNCFGGRLGHLFHSDDSITLKEAGAEQR